MGNQEHGDVVPAFDAFPKPRMKPFLDATNGKAEALKLYAWQSQMAGAALEQISHLEVLLRHPIDTQLSLFMDEEEGKIPWFLLPPFYPAQAEAIDLTRQRLREQKRETRDQIIAGLSFGFWTGWLGAKYEDLWRQSLHAGFPNGSGKRKEIARLVEQIRKFRNRVAHHDSLLNMDVVFEMQAVFELARIIDEDAAKWMKSVDRTQEVGALKPVNPADTVIVPGEEAWEFYEDAHAYICQAGRFFRDVKHLAFYADREIKPEIPQVKARLDNVVWNKSKAMELQGSNDREKRKLGKVMELGLKRSWQEGIYQVFLLTRPGDPKQVTLEHALNNPKSGKSSGFVRKQRYSSIHQLQHAKDVWSAV